MSTTELKAEFRAAQKALIAIECKRQELLATTDEAYEAALLRVDDAIDAGGGVTTTCESCEDPIFEGEPYHQGRDVDLCSNCAPSYADIVADPSILWNADAERFLTQEEADAIAVAHIANGGDIDDKIVSL